MEHSVKRFPGGHSFERRGQAMVEFMLALPVLVILLYGIIEFSRLVFIFASTANASRQAARYGAGAGEIATGTTYFQDCEGIREVANRSAILTEFDEITITYDRGVTSDGEQIPINEELDPNPQMDSCPIEDNLIRNGDRIIVHVSTTYEPIIRLLPIEPLTVVSTSARTFLISVPIFGSALPMEFHPESPTPSLIPTDPNPTDTPPPTATSTRIILPTLPGGTPGVFPTRTDAPPPTLTFTPSRTPLPSFTPSITPTFISCSGETGVGHGPLIVRDNFMRMGVFNNTGHTLTVAQLYVEWNHDTGHRGSDPSLRLSQILFANQAWQGDLHAPSAFIPGYYPTIPPGESTIEFRFHQNYTIEDGTERIIITIGTPGCINYPIDSRK